MVDENLKKKIGRGSNERKEEEIKGVKIGK